MFDYATLKVIWWGLMSLIVIAYAITGGADIGVNLLLPIIGKNDDERRTILSTIGPTWEGNQVWLITLGAGAFAIWPVAYATIFSSMYLAFMLVLFLLILRPPGFDYRDKLNFAVWRRIWDVALFSTGIGLAFCFGLVVGNFFTGIPFHFDEDLRATYTGHFITLFSPCAILFGIVSVCLLSVQGALFLQYKLPEKFYNATNKVIKFFCIGYVVFFIVTGFYLLSMPGYIVKTIPDLSTIFIVTEKIVEQKIGGWFTNYMLYKWLWFFPIFALVGCILTIHLAQQKKDVKALIIHSLVIACTVLTAAIALFPFVMPSSSVYNHGLTIWDIASSKLTLEWALFAVIIFLPIILLYTGWVYKVTRGKVMSQNDNY